MMGQRSRTESLFYYFRLEDQIPEDYLLRLIDHHVDLSFVRERLKSFYSSTGRPSIDPEVLLRLLLVGYLYGITSERPPIASFSFTGTNQPGKWHGALVGTSSYKYSQRARYRIEALFADSNRACSCGGYDYAVCGMSARSFCWLQLLKT